MWISKNLRRACARQNDKVTGPRFPPTPGEPLIAWIGIDMEHAAKISQMFVDMPALAVFGIKITHRRRRRAAPWPVIHRV